MCRPLAVLSLAASLLLLPAPSRAAEDPDLVIPDEVEEVDGRHWAFSAAPIKGTLRDAVTGEPVRGALVRIKRSPGGDDHFHEMRTDIQGYFRARTRFGTYYVDITHPGYASILDLEVYTGLAEASPPLNLPLSHPVGADQLRISLSWCKEKPGAVKDVDSYLRIPGHPIYDPLCYKHKAGSGHQGAHLDRDDTDWEGPETVTIREMRAGTYVYYVNAYSPRNDCEALGRSGVRVTVTRGDRTVKTYLIGPSSVADGVGITYRLFHIVDGEIRDTDAKGEHVRGYDDKLFVHGSHETECRNEPLAVRWDILEAVEASER